MAQDYYFNSTKLNDWDGSKGVIVSTIDHDSSPDVSLTEAEVARGPGKVLRQTLHRGKRINLTGAIVGSSQADFEARLDALKALLAQPGQLTVTNYGAMDSRICVFEEGEAWVRTYVNSASVDDAPLWDFTHYKIGTRGLTVEATSASPKSATLTQTFDLSSFTDADTIKLWAYVPVAADLNSVELQLTTSGGNYYSKAWTGLSTGWNELTVLRSALTTVGAPSWANITSISLIVTGATATAAPITFDDLRISTTADSRTYDVTLEGPVQLQRDHYHSYWVPFSLSFTASDGRARSSRFVATTRQAITSNQAAVPLYLAGSGPQPVALTSTVGSAIPSEVAVYDHVADVFGSYKDRYMRSVATFEAAEAWDVTSPDTVNVKFGTQGLKLTATASSTTSSALTFAARDYSALPNTELAGIWVYLADATKCASLSVTFVTTASTDYYTATWNAGLVTGWNYLTLAKKSLVATGSPSWASIVGLTVSVTANGSGSAVATFDDMHFVSALGCTGGRFTTYSTGASSWEVNEVGAYKTALVHSGAFGTTGHAFLSNVALRDGEIIALCRAPDSAGALGFWARTQTPSASPTSGIGFAATQNTSTSFFQAFDLPNTVWTTFFVTSTAVAVSSKDWIWLRLVVKGSLVQGYYRTPDQDDWTKIIEGSTQHLTAGYWGLYTDGRAEFAHVEVIDYTTNHSNELRLLGGPFSSSVQEGMFALDTGTLMAREGPLPGTFAGSFPAFSAGFNGASVVQPAAIIGSARFRYAISDIAALGGNYFYIFGRGTGGSPLTPKTAIGISTGAQTYIRRRGSYIYIGKVAAFLPAYDLTVRIETDAAGSPSGALVHANATASLLNSDITTQGELNHFWNSSWHPYELVFAGDFPVTASTSLWVVLTANASELDPSWIIPNAGVDTGANHVKTLTDGIWTAPGTASGHVILAGNNPNAVVSTPWTVTTAHTPSFL